MGESRSVSNGIVAGAIAGIILTFIIILGERTEVLASIIGLPHKIGGLLIHFFISLLAGVIFAWILGWLVRSWWSAVFWGLSYGLLIWVIGPLTFLPLLNNQSLFSTWNSTGLQANLPAFVGYLIYGFILGLSYCFLKKGKLHKLKKPLSQSR